MQDLKIRVGGLADLSRALKKIDAEAPKQLRLTFNAAADLLITRARPKIPQRSGAAARSLKARSTRTSARIAVGGNQAPYYPWLDFGGQGRIDGRPVHRPFITEGRYIYPTLVEIKSQVEDIVAQGIRVTVENVGLEVT